MQDLVNALDLGLVAVQNDEVSIHLVPNNAYRNNIRCNLRRLEKYQLVCVILIRVDFLDKTNLNFVGVAVKSCNYLRQGEIKKRCPHSQCNLVYLM